MSGELAKRSEKAVAIRNVLKAYEGALGELLPRTGVTPAAFMGFAREAVARDEYITSIAMQNPESLMTTLMKCAMLGHIPGSKNYAIVAFGGKAPSVQGIEQYHGLIDRSQRAAPGLVVAASVVRENDDFVRENALGEPAVHRYPPFASAEERGKIIGVYAQARLPEGTYTQSVTLSPEQIAKYKAKSRSDKFWNAWPEEMAMKTAILRLRGLPQSAEYLSRMGQLTVTAERVAAQTGASVPNLDEHPDVYGDDPDDAPIGEIVE